MRRYLYSFYIKVMVFLLLLFPFIFLLICLILDTAQKGRIYIPGCIACFTCIIVYCLTLIITFILDKKAKNCVFFENGKLTYKNRTLFADEVSVTYFKFYLNLTCELLVIPKILIEGKDFSVSLYFSRRDLRKLKKMGFKVNEIRVKHNLDF